MKTPKEILLAAHQALAPRLDQMREDVLAAELGGAGNVSTKRRNSFAAVPVKLWNELIWPSRRAWAGLAAVWVALAVVHFSQRGNEKETSSNPDPQMLAEWDEQQKILEQFINERTQVAEKASAPMVPPAASGKSAEADFDDEHNWA
jgi:hypothetical protein